MTSTCLTAPTTSKYIAAIVIGLISRVPHTFAGFECVGSRVGQATWTPTHSKSRNEWGTRPTKNHVRETWATRQYYSRVNFTYFHVANTPIDTASMTAVAVQPTTRRYRGIVNLSITFLLDAICMMTTISGAAKMPFKTAAQKRARIGLIPIKFKAMPIKVAAAIIV